MPPTSISSNEDPRPFHPNQTNNSSSSSIATIQRSESIGPSTSNTRSASAAPPSTDSAYVSNTTSNFSKLVSSPESRRRPSASHSRSNSVSGVRDGVGNLNRWSQSTTSSKGSAAHTRSNSFSRRMSFGGPGAFTFGAPAIPTTNKLQKSRPSVGESPPRLAPSGRPFDFSSNPALTLPPIITQPAFNATNDLISPLTGTTISPSTGGILSAAVHATVPDYFGKNWEESIPRDFTQPKGPQTSRSPLDHPNRSAGPSVKLRVNTGPPSSQRYETAEATDRGHSRNRSQAGKDSAGTNSSDKTRSSKQPSQKAMLSKALQKANTAVLLDNAQNFEGAMEAYSEACNLLQQVMLRSSGDEDKRKLEAIRNTYTSRISELEKIALPSSGDGKALPARPESGNYKDDMLSSPIDDEETAVIETATVTRIINDPSYVPEQQPRQALSSQLPKRRESLLPSAFDTAPKKSSLNPSDQYLQSRNTGNYPLRERIIEANTLAPPMNSEYMPPPLSPRRPLSPTRESDAASRNQLSVSPARGHARVPSNESMSWLDTIDESGGSAASSVHSRTSSRGVRRKHIRAASGDTEAEFDAALDAAVEAAYDEGFEPEDDSYLAPAMEDYDTEVVNVRKKVELARERVRQTERETAIQMARDRERIRILQEKRDQTKDAEDDYDENESEEEERMLEEMTRGYVMDDFEFGLQTKSALPRESDSSGFSGRTWNSSIGSNPTTAGTTLSTVTEKSFLPEMPPLKSKTPPPVYPPPAQALPPPPSATASHSPSLSAIQPNNTASNLGVRSRRLSGQNAKQLKIETTTKSITAPPLTLPPSMPPPRIPSIPTSSQPQTAGILANRQPIATSTNRPPGLQGARQASSPFPGPSASEAMSPPTPNLTQTFSNDSDNGSGSGIPRSGSPGRPHSRSMVRKNFSSSSLKNLKGRNLSVSNADDGSDSPNTPMSNGFGISPGIKDPSGRLPAMPTLPTPIASAFRDKMSGLPTGGLYLFNNDVNSPESPGSLNPLSAGGGPIPLEPCPTEFLLRPFWLMRALYQTIAHPKGGYVSNKLFVPKDVWRVKGVKIKAVEDKIANCDYLTAALQKLAKVDTCDADSVLDEMQALENVLEQVQLVLIKKLGNEVGVQGSGVLFKDASTGGEAENSTSGSKTPSSSKSSFSWRRLRSKNSGVGLANSYTSKSPPVPDAKEGLTMSTLPMTSLATIRFAKRDIGQVQFSGPNANYMAALARLFDAAQVIDQIARQVEDPGLRHADKTQVGLELSTRHAAEFFGFYICRFVLTDLSLLLDKFIKRGSEWVVL